MPEKQETQRKFLFFLPRYCVHSSLHMAQIYQPVDFHGKAAPSQAAPYAKWEPQTRIQNKLPESPTGLPDFCAAPAAYSLQPSTPLNEASVPETKPRVRGFRDVSGFTDINFPPLTSIIAGTAEPHLHPPNPYLWTLQHVGPHPQALPLAVPLTTLCFGVPWHPDFAPENLRLSDWPNVTWIVSEGN